MKQLIIIFFLIFGLACSLSAQGKLKGPLDVVYLKDGSVLRGKVRAYEIGKILRLQITPTSSVAITGDRIEKVVQQEAPAKKVRGPKAYQPLTFDGWYSTTRFYGLGGYFAEEFQVGLGIQTTFGRDWNQWLGTGFGVGYDNYFLDDRVSLIPIFVELKGQFSPKHFSPAYSLHFGYSLANKDEDLNIHEARGGFMAHAAIGFVKHTMEGNALNFDIGYRFQRLKYRQDFFNVKDFEEYKILYKRLAVRFGFTF